MTSPAVSESREISFTSSGDLAGRPYPVMYSPNQAPEGPSGSRSLTNEPGHRQDPRSLAFIRGQRLSHYLRQVSQAGDIDHYTAVRAGRAWRELRAATSARLPVPDACPGPDGELLFTWDLDEHHLEVEIYPSGQAEAFYRNRASGELWERRYDIDLPVPLELRDKLGLLIPHE